MNPNRFEKSSSGKLIKIQTGSSAYWAFIPNPLPPELNFDVEFVSAISDAASALGELAGLGRTMTNPQLLINPFLQREAVSSSRIEGTQAGIADLYVYQAGGQMVLPFFDPEFSKHLPVISATLIQRKFKVTYATANKAIQRLAEMGILTETNSTKKRNKFYYAADIFRILI